MNLQELSNEIVEISGRLDLSEPTVLSYLNKGIKLLDTLLKGQRKDSRFIQVLDIGRNVVVLPAACRVISNVYTTTQDIDKRVELSPVSLSELREFYNNFNSDLSCKPMVYTPISLDHYDPDALRIDQLGCFIRYGDFVLTDPYQFTGLAIYPVPVELTAIEIFGQFYTPELTADKPMNWWTINHAELVVKAALFKLNSDYYNTTGQKATLDEIIISVQEIIYDFIEESANHRTVLEG